MRRKAVVLLSGGLDSTTCAAIAIDEGFAVHALSFAYGQRHAVELEAADRVARTLAVTEHLTVDIHPAVLAGSALTGGAAVPKDRDGAAIDSGEIPVTYVPARNALFLSYALSWAEAIGAEAIFIGVNALDFSGYPDCRPDFIDAFQTMADRATKAGREGSGIEIRAPLQHMTKKDVVETGRALGVNYAMTISRYDPDTAGAACGRCDACQLRKKGFADAGVDDPTRYAN